MHQPTAEVAPRAHEFLELIVQICELRVRPLLKDVFVGDHGYDIVRVLVSHDQGHVEHLVRVLAAHDRHHHLSRGRSSPRVRAEVLRPQRLQRQRKLQVIAADHVVRRG